MRARVLQDELEGAELLVGVVAHAVRERVVRIQGDSPVGAHVEDAIRTRFPFDVSIWADQDILELILRFLDRKPGHQYQYESDLPESNRVYLILPVHVLLAPIFNRIA
jgi:hypothetical protein